MPYLPQKDYFQNPTHLDVASNPVQTAQPSSRFLALPSTLHWDPWGLWGLLGDMMVDHMMAHYKEVDWVQVRTGEDHGEEGDNACSHLPHVLGLLTPHISETRIEDQRMG